MTSFHAERCYHLVSEHEASSARLSSSVCQFLIWSIFVPVFAILGAERLVKHLRRHNIPMALATGSNQWSYGIKTSRHQQFFSLFHHVVCSADDPEVKRGKPEPDCFLVAAQRFPNSPPPEKVYIHRVISLITSWKYWKSLVI